MKKKFLLLSVFFLIVLNGYSSPRTLNGALVIADNFYKNRIHLKSWNSENRLTLAYISGEKTKSSLTHDEANYFVFNVGERNGFIIVSGDTRVREILGYSDANNFDINNIPDNLRYWLSYYESEIEKLSDISVSLSEIEEIKSKSSVNNSIEPLLGDIKWGQDAPYNNLCPVVPSGYSYAGQRTVAGCIATAMAQVMKYHEWPLNGKGSNTYTTRTLELTLSEDFSETTYDWTNMTDQYRSSSTDIEKNAVATLMYHCGVAAYMDYYVSSGAMHMDMAKALVDNFDYSPNLQLLLRDYYRMEEWEEIIKKELNEKRPVLYSGSSLTSGHAFVCDGYDEDGLFHFNWGWNGMSDGYFQLSALNPGALGTGGGNGGYNANQNIVIGIAKPDGSNIQNNTKLGFRSLTIGEQSVNRSSEFTTRINSVANLGYRTFEGKVGLALYDMGGTIKYIDKSDASLGAQYTTRLEGVMEIPADIEEGDYKLYPVYSFDDVDWIPMMAKVGTPQYLNVEITSESIVFSHPTENLPSLVLNSVKIERNFYSNKTGEVIVEVTNSGAEEYNSNLLFFLQSTEDAENTAYIGQTPVNILAGETKTYTLSGTLAVNEGEYILRIMYDPNNNRMNFWQRYSRAFDYTETVIVRPEPMEAPVVSLIENIYFPDAEKVYKNDAVLIAKIKNTGGYFEKLISVAIYHSNGSFAGANLGNQTCILDAGEEKEVNFRGSINLDPGRYIAVACYVDDNSGIQFTPYNYSRVNFTLVDEITGVEAAESNDTEDFTIYPNPVSNILNIKSEGNIENISITDILGKQVLTVKKPDADDMVSIDVLNLVSGTYIIRVITNNGIRTAKFIKE